MIKKFFVLILMLSSCRSMQWTKLQTMAIFGEKLYLNKFLYDYNTERYIMGDGYSFSVFKIPDNYFLYLMENFSEIKQNFPQHNNDFRPKWEIEHWKETPIANDKNKFHNDLYSFVLLIKEPFENPMQAYYVDYFDKVVNEEGNYYCYFYKTWEWTHKNDGKKYIGDIDFYVFIPKDKIIIMINHQT